MSDDQDLPLTGITVLDMGQVYLGPYAGFLLAQAGADVIKIEALIGEPARRRTAGKGAQLPLAMLNSNKRAVTLNLKAERGKELFIELVRRADVVVENFAPGVLARLGIGWQRLHEENPRLVYGSGSGYGLSGPDKDNLAMDLTVQAAAGIMSITGFADGPPLKAGAAVADFLGGTHLFAAIMTALFQRERTGRGRLVEIAMQETVYPSLASNLGLLMRGSETPDRTGNHHGGLGLSPYNVYETADGFVAIINSVDDHWQRLCKAMQRPELIDDPRFSDNKARSANMAVTDSVVSEWTIAQTTTDIVATLRSLRVPCGPVRDLIEIMNDPHMHERGMLHWIDHPDLGRIVVPGSPLRFHGSTAREIEPSPRLGEHNAAIYGKFLGLPASEIANLKSKGVI
ncbi:MAG: CaiB/BaiF CoA transferase family protein [Rhodospirillales bacterium]|jgi:CoA:oxalate CoA-transferase